MKDWNLSPLEKVGLVAVGVAAVVIVGAIVAPKAAAGAVGGGLAGLSTKLLVYALGTG